jgi:hypothetical protein
VQKLESTPTRRRSLFVSLAGAALLHAGLACEHEPLPGICPDVQEGELVITELRGPQTGADTYGQWVELRNASGRKLDLRGVKLLVQPGDGSEAARLIIREPLDVEDGAFVVLGRQRFDDPSDEDDPYEPCYGKDDAPSHMEYCLGMDFQAGLDPSGVLELYACDVLVDRLVYRSLPTDGSFAFDGAKEPDADANDDEDCWCEDATEAPDDGPQTEIGLPGTPGEENRPCP